MPAPTNISAATATDLGTLPASTSQNAHDSGTTYTLWFRYTATVDDVVVGLFCYGDATYTVRTQVFNNILATNPYEIIDTGIGADANRAVQFAVTPGTTYYIKCAPPSGNPTPAVLLIEAETFASQTASVGFITVPDDTPGFPLTLINPATEAVERFVSPFPAGEAGDVLDSGVSLVHDVDVNGLALFDDQFNEITTVASISMPSLGGAIRTCQDTQRFWFAYVTAGPILNARYIEDDGTLGTNHVLTAITDVAAIASNNAESVLYYSASNNSALRQWNLSTDTAMADLVAHVSGYQMWDILVLSDDSIVASYIKTSATVDVQVRRYNAAGALQNTYNFGSAQLFPGGTLPRLAYAIDDPNSFWIWTHPSGADAGKSKFEEVTVSDGSIATSVLLREYETGIYEGTATATPDARFGNSFSCPFWISRVEFPNGGGPPTGTIRVVKVVIGETNGSFLFTAGGGLTPSSFSLQGGEEHVFNNVPVGTYSLSEVAPECFELISVDVSNGSPQDAITVEADEVVVVTFTNGQVIGPNCGAPSQFSTDPIRWLRRSPTVFSDGKRIFHRRFQVDFMPGQGLSVASDEHDHNPIVLCRTSDDGGFTWSSFREMTLGAQGQYLKQMKLYQLGSSYGRVYEVSGDSPTPFCLVQAWLDIEGSDR